MIRTVFSFFSMLYLFGYFIEELPLAFRIQDHHQYLPGPMFTNVSGVSATGVSVVGAEATSAFLSIVSERTVIQCMDVHAFYTQTLNLRSKSIAEDFVDIILLIILSKQIFQFCILTIFLNFTHKK